MLVFFVLACLGVIFCSKVTLEYFFSEGDKNASQYVSYYDTSQKTPWKTLNIYRCEWAKAAVSTPSPPRPSFIPDPRLSRKLQANDSDYSSSGYSRGHLSTAKFWAFNGEAYKNSFYLTNVAPVFIFGYFFLN